LALIAAVPSTAGAPPGPGGEQPEAIGAAAFDDPDFDPIAALSNTTWFVPAATEATDDVPAAYGNGCQQKQVDADVIRCDWGAKDGDATVVVVGDSKIEQWETALDAIAKKHGWHVISYTKSACAFSSATQMVKGKPYESCVEWNKRVFDEIASLHPTAVLTSSRVTSALEDVTDLDSRSSEALIEGLVDVRGRLQEQGIPVITIMDNPSPTRNVYECVAENSEALDKCTFDLAGGRERSGYEALTETAKQLEGSVLVDLTDRICVDGSCPPCYWKCAGVPPGISFD